MKSMIQNGQDSLTRLPRSFDFGLVHCDCTLSPIIAHLLAGLFNSFGRLLHALHSKIEYFSCAD